MLEGITYMAIGASIVLGVYLICLLWKAATGKGEQGMESDFVYALYNRRKGYYQTSGGYYGNECNIACFPTREAAEKHIKTYKSNEWRAKRLRVRETTQQPKDTE